MISMVERKDIISAYEQTGSMRAVSIELGLSRKTVKKYGNRLRLYPITQPFLSFLIKFG